MLFNQVLLDKWLWHMLQRMVLYGVEWWRIRMPVLGVVDVRKGKEGMGFAYGSIFVKELHIA